MSPHIVSVVEFGQTQDGLLFLAMELLRGKALSTRLREEGRLAPARALSIGIQLCDALQAAHEHDVVHRDLKPGNVLVLDEPADRDFIKVLDFGLAKSSAADSHSSQTSQLMGTPAYIAPEAVLESGVDRRADLYSVGVILYELVAGLPPFSSESVNNLLLRHVHAPPPDLPEDVPEGLASIIFRLLAKDPDDRYRSATEAREALERARDEPRAQAAAPPRRGAPRGAPGAGSGVTQRVDVAHGPRAAPSRRRRAAGAAVAAALAALAALVAFFALGADEAGESGGASRGAAADGEDGARESMAAAPASPADERPPAADERPPAADERPSDPTDEGPATADERPPTADERPPTADERPPGGDEDPAPASAEFVEFSLTSSPRAGVRIDGEFLGQTPLDVEVERGDEPIDIEFRRPGRRIVRRAAPPDRARAIDVALPPPPRGRRPSARRSRRTHLRRTKRTSFRSSAAKRSPV